MTRDVTIAGYIVIAAAVATHQFVARRREGTTLGQLTALVARWPPTRWALFGGWLWLGWHLFVRVEWR